MLAMNRQRSMLSGVCWNAMMNAPIEYQSSAKVKIERRPKRSDNPAEHQRADEHPGKQRGDKTGEAGEIEQTLGGRRENALP